MIEQFFLALFDVLPALVVGGLLGVGVTHLYREYRETSDLRKSFGPDEHREYLNALFEREARKFRQ